MMKGWSTGALGEQDDDWMLVGSSAYSYSMTVVVEVRVRTVQVRQRLCGQSMTCDLGCSTSWQVTLGSSEHRTSSTSVLMTVYTVCATLANHVPPAIVLYIYLSSFLLRSV